MIYYLSWLKWNQRVEEEVNAIQRFKTIVSTPPFCLQLNFLQELILGFAFLLHTRPLPQVELIKPHLASLVILISSLECCLSYYNVITIRWGSRWQDSQQCNTISRAALTKACNTAWSHSYYILIPLSLTQLLWSVPWLPFILRVSLLALSLLLSSVWLTNIVALEYINLISANFYFYHLILISSLLHKRFSCKQYFPLYHNDNKY